MTISNATYILTTVVAFHKHEYIRAVLFLYVAATSSFYHLCADTDLCREHEALATRLDLAAAVWTGASILMMFSTLPRECEFVIEVINGVVTHMIAFYALGVEYTWEQYVFIGLFPLIVVPAVIYSWTQTKGLPLVRLGWVIIGVFMIAAGVVFVFVTITPSDLVDHGIWHISTALGSAALFVGLRDAHLRRHQQQLGGFHPIPFVSAIEIGGVDD